MGAVSGEHKFAFCPKALQPNEVHRRTYEEPLRLNFFESSDRPASKPYVFLDPSKHRFDCRGTMFQCLSHRLVSQFLPLPYQRPMVGMNLYGPPALTAAALPAHRTRFITLAAIHPHFIRMGFVSRFDGIKLQSLPSRADAL